MKVDPEVRKQLDALVGESYDPPRRWRATALKWLAAAVLAVAASGTIVAILHTHVMQAQTTPSPKRPVPVTIVPAK